jgi:uncharacterized membrane protein
MNVQVFYTWAPIALMILASTAGDVLVSKAMKQIGDLGELWKSLGLRGVAARMLRSGTLLAAVCSMGIAFYMMLFALSHADVSLVVPAGASLTFVTNAIAARLFLHENVDHRRWAAAILVGIGVVLMSR